LFCEWGFLHRLSNDDLVLRPEQLAQVLACVITQKEEKRSRLGHLSEGLLEQADYHVKIPMYGFTESFNLSVSVALLLQVLKERINASTLPWQLTSDEQTHLKIEWCKRMLNGGEMLEKQFRNVFLEKEF
jgi:tRNA C32,U32 (ribose-2'-O)-methylase TrmJ